MKVRIPSGVGTRPAEAWACSTRPDSWSSASVLRILADDSGVGISWASACEATGDARST